MIVILANSPFEDEIRLDCEVVKLNVKKLGEVCILSNYTNTIFDVENTDIEVKNGNKKDIFFLKGSGIVKVKDNYVYCFGQIGKKNV